MKAPRLASPRDAFERASHAAAVPVGPGARSMHYEHAAVGTNENAPRHPCACAPLSYSERGSNRARDRFGAGTVRGFAWSFNRRGTVWPRLEIGNSSVTP